MPLKLLWTKVIKIYVLLKLDKFLSRLNLCWEPSSVIVLDRYVKLFKLVYTCSNLSKLVWNCSNWFKLVRLKSKVLKYQCMYYFDLWSEITKAKLLLLRPHPLICQKSFINKKSWKSKKVRPPSIQLLKYYNKSGLIIFDFQLFHY